MIGGHGDATTSAASAAPAFSPALQAAGPSLPNRTLIKDGGFEREAARTATFELLDLPDPPTAIFSANNTMSLGVLQALHERGLNAPADVSIVGFDDMPWQVAMQPPLTCIAQPTYDIGATAARLLLERIGEPSRPVRRVVLETALVVRASSGASAARDRPHAAAALRCVWCLRRGLLAPARPRRPVLSSRW